MAEEWKAVTWCGKLKGVEAVGSSDLLGDCQLFRRTTNLKLNIIASPTSNASSALLA
jgi:hypothetical protein